MSIFGFLRKKKKDKEENIEPIAVPVIEEGVEQVIRRKKEEQRIEPKEIVLEDYTPTIPLEEISKEQEETLIKTTRSTEECVAFLNEKCEEIVETKRFTENAKIEYQAVTEYLADVQKIELMESGERKLLNDSAERILKLTKEQEEYQQREISPENPCFRMLRKYENRLLEELKQMREQEDYKKIVQNDLRQLEAEKAALRYDYERIPSRQEELKKIVLVVAALVVSLFALFFALDMALEQSMTIPFLMTVLMAAGVLAYIFYEGYRNRYEYALLEKKLNRTIQLANKVKIKYINNTSSLDYSYSKYNVKSSMEFEYLIKEYTKAKEAERSYMGTADRLQHYRHKVMDILEMHEVKDAEIWLHQLPILFHPEEFDQMKQGLENRKKRLMERMDDNAKLRDQCFEHMHVVLAEKPELRDTLLQLMKQYDISF